MLKTKQNIDEYFVVNAHNLAVGRISLCDYNRRPFTSVGVFAVSFEPVQSMFSYYGPMSEII
jgi:hypothetical protein